MERKELEQLFGKKTLRKIDSFRERHYASARGAHDAAHGVAMSGLLIAARKIRVEEVVRNLIAVQTAKEDSELQKEAKRRLHEAIEATPAEKLARFYNSVDALFEYVIRRYPASYEEENYRLDGNVRHSFARVGFHLTQAIYLTKHKRLFLKEEGGGIRMGGIN